MIRIELNSRISSQSPRVTSCFAHWQPRTSKPLTGICRLIWIDSMNELEIRLVGFICAPTPSQRELLGFGLHWLIERVTAQQRIRCRLIRVHRMCLLKSSCRPFLNPFKDSRRGLKSAFVLLHTAIVVPCSNAFKCTSTPQLILCIVNFIYSAYKLYTLNLIRFI